LGLAEDLGGHVAVWRTHALAEAVAVAFVVEQQQLFLFGERRKIRALLGIGHIDNRL